jgi:hypothetical protein
VEVGVEGDPGGIVAMVLEATKALEEELEDVVVLSRHVVVEVGEYPAHPGCRLAAGYKRRMKTSR